jgi:MoaA/NifB/PqqE/SkfB family radical SAM enzyme
MINYISTLDEASYIEGYKQLVVTWDLGNFCPYSCSYCPDEFHNGSIEYHQIDAIFKVFAQLPKNTIVTFMGGEPTYHPDFENIIENKPDNIKIAIISNAARPLGFWERIAPNLTAATLSFHSEHTIPDRFFEVGELIYKKNKVYGKVFLIMNPEKWDYCVDIYNKLNELQIPVTPKPILENFGFLSTNIISTYTKHQIDWLTNENQSRKEKTIKIFDQDKELIYETNSSELILKKLNNFKNWNCYAGMYHLSVEYNGDIHDTRCRQRRLLGNINSNFYLPTSPIICEQSFCSCQSDLQVKKIKPL